MAFIDKFFEYAQENAELLGKKWDLVRELASLNYTIHTEAVRENIIPIIQWHTKNEGLFFAVEADLLNEVVFGMKAAEWRQQHPDKQGNIRDHATEEQLHLLSNLEALVAKTLFCK